MIALTVKRENGNIETINKDIPGMSDILFAKIQEATVSAGGGEVLSWELVDDRTDDERTKQAELNAIHTKRKAAGWCDKCQSYCYGDCEAN